ncbi:MAG: MBL fold metallo-hydrolase, partial [Nocardioidaceae bacterium]|nr:MBL fold metallo-hydrolase [Nocardioidaceae bacterium]
MTYSGKVKPGSPQVRELADLIITKASVGPMDNNAFLLQCRGTGSRLLVDAAAEAAVLLQMLSDEPLDSVVTTHRHGDHWGALAEIVRAKSPTTLAGAADVEGIPVVTDKPVDDGDTILVGSCQLEVIHLVGHTPGSIALLYDDPAGPPHLWTG